MSSSPTSMREYFSAYRETINVLLWVWRELTTKQSRYWSWIFVVLSGVTLLILTIQPLIFGWLVSSIENKNIQLILAMAGALYGLALLQQGISFLSSLSREWLLNRNALQIHDRLNVLFYEKTLGQHAEEGSSLNYESIEKAKNRMGNIQEMVFFETTQMVFGIIFSLLFLWYLLWEAALLITILMVVHIFWSLYLNYHVSVSMEPIEREFRFEHKQLIERWEKIVRVKTSAKTKSEHARLSGWLNEILKKDRKFWFWFIKQATVREFFGQMIRVLSVGYGVYLVYFEEKDIGFLVPLYTWVTQIVQNLWYFGHAERRINEQIPYIKAMRDVLSMAPSFSETKGITFESGVPVGITFKNVGLSYGEGHVGEKVSTLRGISFSIKPGEKVALIGPSGAGKSSIMRLLLRFMDPSEGEIWINGYLLKDIKLASWMMNVGYIPQDGQVFDGTLRYNLTFGLSEKRQKSITDEEIWDVMRLLQIDFGDRLVSGIETLVGRDGMKLSGGERQRLIAGAAVIKRPIFMIIDEATSSLDSTTEKAVQRGFKQVLSGPAGALIVAHRLSTVRTICDRFIVLRKLSDTPQNESQIEAIASSFEELYKISPTFKKLADDQEIAL